METVHEAGLAAPTTDLLAGRYRRLERITRGASGQTWRAHDERLGRPVLVQSAPWRAGAAGLVHVLARAWSPVAAPLLDAGADAGQVYAVFPHSPWPSLAGLVAHGTSLSGRHLTVLAATLREAVSALEAATGDTVALSTHHVVLDPEWQYSSPTDGPCPLHWMPALGPVGRAGRRRHDVDAVLSALREAAGPRRFAATKPRLTLHHPTIPPHGAERRTPCVSVPVSS